MTSAMVGLVKTSRVAHFASNKMNILFVALLYNIFFINNLRCDDTLKLWIRVCLKSFSKTFDKNSNVPMQIDMMYLPMHDMMLYKRFHLFFRNWGMSVKTWTCARLKNYLE